MARLGMGTLALMGLAGVGAWWFFSRRTAAIGLIPFDEMTGITGRATAMGDEEISVLKAAGKLPADATIVMVDPAATAPIRQPADAPGTYVISPLLAGWPIPSGAAGLQGYRDYVQLGNVLYTGEAGVYAHPLTIGSGSASGTEGLWY